jgi:hypothetical protein
MQQPHALESIKWCDIYYYVFPVPSREPRKRREKEFQKRDGLALRNLESAVQRNGLKNAQLYRYRDEIRNVEGAGDPVGLQIPYSDSQLLLAATRPPISDPTPRNGDKGQKRIKRTDEPLERSLLKRIGKYLAYCTREQVQLTVHAAQHLRGGYENRACVNFLATDCARLTLAAAYGPMTNAAEDTPNHTLAYLLNLPAESDSPRIIWSFGMSGVQTLLWNKCLAQRYSHLLDSHQFVIVEFEAERELGGGPKGPAQLEHVVDSMHVETILAMPL